jgi:RHS repeat-associated protein
MYPWGALWTSAGDTEFDEHFAGFTQIDGLAMIYPTPARRYAPPLGRWLSPDPMGGDLTNPQSLNRYAYALNNPETLTDPLGSDPIRPCTNYHTFTQCLTPGGTVNSEPSLSGTINGWDEFGLLNMGSTTVSQPVYSGPPDDLTLVGYNTYTVPGAAFTVAMLPLVNAQQTSWWGTFARSFFMFAGGPGNVPTCAGQALRQIGENLNPFSPGSSTAADLAAPAAQAVAVNRGLTQTTAAIDEYITQQGLIVPLRSSVVRTAIATGTEDAVAAGARASLAVQTVAVDIAAFRSLLTTMGEARNGGCAAAFPTF